MNVIRWVTSIYIMVFLAISINLQAQEKHALLQKQVRVTNTLLSLDALSAMISKQTGIYLSFNANKVTADKKIAFQKRMYTVKELLELIKSNTGSSYSIYQDHVIFQANRKTADHKVVSTLKNTPLKKAGSRSIANKNISTDKKEDKQVVRSSSYLTKIVEQNIIFSSPLKQLNIEPIKVPQLLKTPSLPPLSQKPGFTAQRQTYSPNIPKASWYAEGGWVLDENFYLQPTLTAGHPYLHAVFSWSSNFQVSGFRYGLGTSFPLKNDWRIGLQATTGKLARDIDFKGVRDSSKSMTVKSDLHRLSLLVEKHLNRNIIIKAGPVFNLLHSNYFQNGSPVTITTSGYDGTNGDREFYTIRPLYTLSNTFKTTESSNTKTWIGFQASLFYRINF